MSSQLRSLIIIIAFYEWISLRPLLIKLTPRPWFFPLGTCLFKFNQTKLVFKSGKRDIAIQSFRVVGMQGLRDRNLGIRDFWIFGFWNLEFRIQGLRDLGTQGLGTQGFRDLATQGLSNLWIQGLRDLGIQIFRIKGLRDP